MFRGLPLAYKRDLAGFALDAFQRKIILIFRHLLLSHENIKHKYFLANINEMCFSKNIETIFNCFIYMLRMKFFNTQTQQKKWQKIVTNNSHEPSMSSTATK